MIFGIKEKSNFDPNNVFLAIATNILKTGFVVQGHISPLFLEIVFFTLHYIIYIFFKCHCQSVICTILLHTISVSVPYLKLEYIWKDCSLNAFI